jgi:hypothetical protein
MPEDLPVTKCINVMVGITRSKVIFICSNLKHSATRRLHRLDRKATMSLEVSASADVGPALDLGWQSFKSEAGRR